MSRRIRKSEAYHSNLAPIRRTRLKEVGSSNLGRTKADIGSHRLFFGERDVKLSRSQFGGSFTT
jgi:hypothetical protein